ncbi:hypothetical protein PFISCL1PPCAC_6833, partial [Pristionchus fissidentatus]
LERFLSCTHMSTFPSSSQTMAKSKRSSRPTRREEKNLQQLQQEMVGVQLRNDELRQVLIWMLQQLQQDLQAICPACKGEDVSMHVCLPADISFESMTNKELKELCGTLEHREKRICKDCKRIVAGNHPCVPGGSGVVEMTRYEAESFAEDNAFFGLRMEKGKRVYREFVKIIDFIGNDGTDSIDNPLSLKNGQFLVEWPDREEPTWEESAGFWDRGMVGCFEFLEFLIRKQIDERSKEIEKENEQQFEKSIEIDRIKYRIMEADENDGAGPSWNFQ